jgi:hypothetical protein
MMAEATHPQTPMSNPALARLAAFVGAWRWEARVRSVVMAGRSQAAGRNPLMARTGSTISI